MADIITTLHPENNPNDNLYPNIVMENIPFDVIKALSSEGNLDANSVPSNSVITYVGNGVNTPATSGTLITYCGDYGPLTNGKVQLFVVSTSGGTSTEMYNRFYWGNQWTPWVKTLKQEDIKKYIKALSSEGNLDANSVPSNSVITYVGNGVNTPVTSGTLITYCGDYGLLTNGKVQLFVVSISGGTSTEMYNRFYWGNQWTPWVKTLNQEDVKKYIKALSSEGNLDANSVPSNSVITYVGNGVNTPVTSGTLITYCGDYGPLTNGKVQLFVVSISGGTSTEMYNRFFWGNQWTPWVNLINENNIYFDTLKNYDDYIYRYNTFDSSKNICWYGDSIIANGTLENIFDAYCGTNSTNKAIGGYSYSGVGGRGTIISQLENNPIKNYDYIFIGGGVNDVGADLSLFKESVLNTIQYVINNYTFDSLYIITPISNVTRNNINKSLHVITNIINDVVIQINNNKINVIQGSKFNFPLYNSNNDIKQLLLPDGTHPSSIGYDVYLRGLIKALKL